MELNYRYAVVSFCPDLTAQVSPSLPVALLMIALSGEEMIAAATGWYPQDNEDPISSALLKDMPRFLKAHVNEVCSGQKEIDSEALFCALQHSLRNSVHVSAVSTSMVEHIEAETPEGLASTVTSKAIALFYKEMRAAGLYLVNPMTVAKTIPPLPPLTMWQLPRSRTDASAPAMS